MKQELMTNLYTLVIDNEMELIAGVASKESIFKSRKYSKHVDNILIYHFKGIPIKQLIIDTKDPIDRTDLLTTLERMIDAIDYAKGIVSISNTRIERFAKFINLFDVINYDEEVLF